MTILIGTEPYQVPTNGDLGTMAFQSSDAVSIDQLNVTGNINVGGTIFGTIETASNSNITTTSVDADFYPTFVSATTGNLGLKTNSGITYNPGSTLLVVSGGIITGALLFTSGALSAGNASIVTSIPATSTTTGSLTVAGGIGATGNVYAGNLYTAGRYFGVANTALNASNLVVTATATNATFYPTFVEATTGNIGLRADTGLSYNPSTNVLTADRFAGVADTALAAVSASNLVVTATATNTTFYPAFVEATSGNIGLRADTGLSYNPSTDALTAGQFIPTSATAPSNGMYLVAANTLGFSTNSAGEQIRISSGGNIGIGDSTPTFKITVFADSLDSTGNAQVFYQKFRSTSAQSDIFEITNTRNQQGGGAWTTAGTRLQQKVDSSYMAYIHFNGTSSNVGVGTTNNGGITFGTGITTSPNNVPETMRLTSAGRLGIGTNGPSQALDVNGAVLIRSNLEIESTTAATNTTTGALIVAGGVGITGDVYASGRYFGIANTAINASNLVVTDTTTNATFYPAFVEATSGNIGLRVDSALSFNPSTNTLTAERFVGVAATATNASNLVITSTSTNATFYPAFVEATSGNIGLRVETGLAFNPGTDALTTGQFIPTSATAPANGMYLSATNSLGFATNTGERMRIDSTGNVGLGQSSPSFKIDVNGGALPQPGNSQIMLQRFTTTTGNSDALEITNTRHMQGGASWVSAGIRLQNKLDASWFGYIQFNGTTSNVGLGTTNGAGITFGTGASSLNPNGVPEVMRIDSAGRVGIGTSAASQLLDLNGAALVRSNLSILSATAATSTITGALIVSGGAGIGGALYVGGASVAGTFVPTSASSPSNGMFLTAANTLGFGTNSAERVRIDATGNVGIGTVTTTTSKLYVVGNLTVTNSIIGSTTNVFIGSGGNVAITGGLLVSANVIAQGNVTVSNVIVNNNVTVANSIIGTTSNLRLGNNGNIAITGGLLVSANVITQGNVTVSNVIVNNNVTVANSIIGTTSNLRIGNNGNLVVTGGILTNGGNIIVGSVSVTNLTPPPAGMYSYNTTAAGSGIAFSTSSSRAMTIDENGNVSIGAGGGFNKLYILGNSGTNTNNSPLVVVDQTNTSSISTIQIQALNATTGASLCMVATGGTRYVRTYGTGGGGANIDFMDSTFTTATARFQNGGNAIITGTLTQNASDRRLKDNINVITNAIDKIDAIRGVTFNWVDNVGQLGFHPEQNYDIGVLAQEIEAVIPQAVKFAPFDRKINGDYGSKSGENYLTVQYEKIIPLLIQAIKEQQTIIKSHDNRIAALEARLIS